MSAAEFLARGGKDGSAASINRAALDLALNAQHAQIMRDDEREREREKEGES